MLITVKTSVRTVVNSIALIIDLSAKTTLYESKVSSTGQIYTLFERIALLELKEIDATYSMGKRHTSMEKNTIMFSTISNILLFIPESITQTPRSCVQNAFISGDLPYSLFSEFFRNKVSGYKEHHANNGLEKAYRGCR